MDLSMVTEPEHKSENEPREWTKPLFSRLGGLSQVAGGCGPAHLPNQPYCPPS